MQARLDLQHRLVSIAATSVALGIMVAGIPARAQNAEAEALFNDGIKLLGAGKVAQACDAFDASNRIESRAGTLIRLGECREQNQQLASAWSAYKDALTRVKDQHKREVATAKAAALEPRLSYLTVSVSNDSQVEGLTLTRNGKLLDPMLWNRGLPVDGGDYVIAGHAPGHEAWQTTVHVAVEGGKVSVEVPKFKELSKLRPPPPPPSGPGSKPLSLTESQDRGATQSQGMFTTRRKIGLGAAGASVITVVVGAVLGTSAKGKQNDAFKLCPDPATPCAQADQSNALIQSSHSRTLGANVAFGLAAATAIGAGVLWFTGAPRTEVAAGVSVVPSMAPSATGVAVLGRF